MKVNSLEENLKTTPLCDGSISKIDKIKKPLLQLYSTVKMHLDPAYQAAEALVLNGQINYRNLEHLTYVYEGKGAGTTYTKKVLYYAKKILTDDAEYNNTR